uniref:Uncharacterized protein n=1 Tax=Anguilla anguilla TaxID=7936 RepID=A0A0E9SRY7_ANGAN
MIGVPVDSTRQNHGFSSSLSSLGWTLRTNRNFFFLRPG